MNDYYDMVQYILYNVLCARLAAVYFITNEIGLPNLISTLVTLDLCTYTGCKLLLLSIFLSHTDFHQLNVIRFKQ